MKSLHELDSGEIDQLIVRMRRALDGHAIDARLRFGVDDALAAIESIKGSLREIATLHPDKASKIAAVIARYAAA